MDMQSKAKKLIEMIQTAPVEWKPLGEVFDLKNGYTPSKSVKEYWENGSIPWFRMEDIRENGRILDSALQQISESAIKGGKLFPANSIIMATSATIGEHALITVPFLANQRFTNLSLKPEFTDKFNIYFLYYYCFNLSDWCKKNTTTSSFASVDMNGFKRFPIPIPPLETQQKIVKILDKFTKLEASLEASLEATLEAELALRKRQCRYYRDFLLDFDNQIGGGIADGYQCRLKDVVWKTLGEIAEYSKNRICSDKLNEHNYVGVDNLLQNREGKKLSGYVPSEGKMTEYIINDILLGNIRPYLKKIWQADCTGGTNGDVLVIRVTDEKVNPKYLYQVLADDKFFAFNMKHAKGAKMPRGSKTAIMQYKIPIPPLPEQEKIVAILDKFDTLTHSISEGLPHEIALRRKQYEYYREQLLAFPKAA